jgi:23S rRNA (uridine2552-2'-O)-methyltransferase
VKFFQWNRLCVGNENLGQLGATPIEDPDVTDALYQLGAGAAGKFGESFIARRAIPDAGADLNQLVIVKRTVELIDDAVGEPGVAEHDNGVQGMSQSPQVLLLFLRQWHRGIIVARYMPKRTKSSARWLAEHASDEFVKRAQREGWRSRAVFKLAQIQETEHLLRPGIRCVDLGAAPGGWSQYAARIIGRSGRIVATDILAMDAIPGVEFVQGDFREAAVLEQVLQSVGADKVNLVLSDMAPNMAGIDAVDQPRSMYLAELALEFADRILAPGGDLLVKLFQGAGFDQIIRDARARYGRVVTKKPKASRSRSPEIYLLARQFGMV